MTLISQCVYCTPENGKLKYYKKCLASLLRTVDLKKHRLMIIDNSCSEETEDFIDNVVKELDLNITVLHLKENVGTARGINMAIAIREPGEIVIKTDDDLTWEKAGWVERMESAMTDEVGILGLKRGDVYGEMIADGKLLWCHDIMGTCTAYNPLMLDKVGFLTQPSLYGFDDTIFSVRSEAAGFRNAFMKGEKIVNLDEGGTDYTEWKKREAGDYLNEVGEMIRMIKEGTLNYYYNGD